MIDVILPTHNRAYCLDRSIHSVLSQSYHDLRLMIIDDGSKDDTKKIIETFQKDSRVNYLHQDNQGVSAARNLGIRHAQGEWIAFLDSDDEWLPNKLEKQVKYLEENPTCRFVHSDEIWMRNGVRVNPKKKFDKNSEDLFRR